jgi:hypothetical protein
MSAWLRLPLRKGAATDRLGAATPARLSPWKFGVVAVLLLASLATSIWVARAADTALQLGWWTVDGGGAISSGGSYTVRGAAGQPDAGVPSTGGAYTLTGGFWQALSERIRALFLPLLVRGFSNLAEPCSPANSYCEDHDTYQDAYGPLEPNTDYDAYPEDSTDYYYFELSEPRSVTVRVTNYQADGQLVLRDNNLAQIDVDYEPVGGDGALEVSAAGLGAETYYIQIYTTPGHENPSVLYTLTVTLD